MKKIICALLMIIVATTSAAYAAVTLTVDRDYIDFRTMELGQTVELADQGTCHNQVTCVSTNNRTWYLKVNVMRPFASGANTIPNENFRWKVVDIVNGKGIVYNNKNIENPFNQTLGLVYTSDPSDNNGTEVRLQFRYLLTIPKNQIAGNYFSYVRWTMTETL